MKVKIGPLTYTVVEVDELAGEESGDLMGDASYEKSRIRLERTLPPDVKQIVLWHEILHGILHNADKRDHDEEYIDIISTGIVQILQDNRHLRG